MQPPFIFVYESWRSANEREPSRFLSDKKLRSSVGRAGAGLNTRREQLCCSGNFFFLGVDEKMFDLHPNNHDNKSKKSRAEKMYILVKYFSARLFLYYN